MAPTHERLVARMLVPGDSPCVAILRKLGDNSWHLQLRARGSANAVLKKLPGPQLGQMVGFIPIIQNEGKK